VLDIQKTPTVAGPPPIGAGEILDSTRIAYATLHLLKNQPEEALAIAQRPGPMGGRLRSLALCAEWSTDPTGALDVATGLVTVESKKKDAQLPQYVLLKLSQLATVAAKAEHAKTFTDALTDEGLKAWAKSDGLRQRLQSKRENSEESAAELPDDIKKYRVGHAWGRLAIARSNAALAKDRGVAKGFGGWPKGTIHPFALAGVALGLQDP
jgi:hypothetical protein